MEQALRTRFAEWEQLLVVTPIIWFCVCRRAMVAQVSSMLSDPA